MTRPEAASLSGRTLGDFTVLEKLGEGGHGVVYRAEQRGLGREAVVKVLRARQAGERAVARFLREAQLASKLDHPYAAHVYAFGAERDGVLWIAMELVRGTPLSKVLAAQPGGRMPIARWVGLLDRICEVVHTAHEQGIVHRDLKPDNIMVLSRAGRLLPKLLDLGVARLTVDPTEVDDGGAGTGDVRLTQDGARVGSPFYMAPEQWQSGEVDARTDLYALGVMTYEALAGRVPFGGDVVSEVARAHLHDDPAPLPDDVPAGVGPPLRAALAKDRGARPASALAFAESLRAAAGLGVAADALPRLDEGLRADVAWLPQPLAEAIGAIESARNPHQARDALWEIVHVAARWLGVLALAARSRSGPGPGATADAPAVVDALRELHRRELTDEEWLDLVRALARPFAGVRDAHPIPELVDLAMAESSPFAPLLALRAADGAPATEESLRDSLARTLPILTPLVRALGFLTDYQLVVPRDGGAEVWMGVRKPRRSMLRVDGDAPPGAPILVDFDGRPVLALAPLVAIAPPAPGAPDELFLFAGPGRARGRGARLVAEPHGFERHDDAVWAWFRANLFAVDDERATRDDEAAPYRGLAAFTAQDADRFFGRERQAEAFANQMLVTPLLAVVGPSGAGKSSFVQAGVLPRLPDGWRSIVLRPGPTPLATWRARVDPPIGDGETRVVVVDQFEELFTLCADPDERDRFARALIDAAARDGVRVVITLRDDFLVRAGELAPLRDRLAQGLTLLATPAADDLLRIVVEPARRTGYDFDDRDLPARMVRAVAGQPGALALLSFTAARLWELRDRHFKRLTRAAYDAIGGVEGALAAHADATLDACSAEEQRLVRDAFRHLVTADGTRAVLTRAELDGVLGKSPHAAAVIERLVNARLLVVSEGEGGDERIEVIHEALIAAWPRLVQWRRDDADGARLRDQLRAAARQWADRGRPRGLLWRDEALDDYQRWRRRWSGALPDLDEQFAAASLRDAARGRRVRRAIAATALVVLVSASAALALLYRASSRNARTAQDRLVASDVEQGRRLLVDGDYLRALPYLSAAYSAGEPSRALRLMLHRAMQLADMPSLPGVAIAAAMPDEDHAIVVDDKAEARAWRLSTGEASPPLPLPAGDASDGSMIAIASRIGQVAFVTRQHVMLWDGVHPRALAVAGALRLGFDATGTRLAIATEGRVSSWSTADGVERWSAPIDVPPTQVQAVGDAVVILLQSGALRYVEAGATRDLGTAARIAYGSPVEFAAFDGQGIAVWTARGELVRRIDLPDIANAAVSPDGTRVAVSAKSGVIALLDVTSGALLSQLSGHQSQARVAFTLDGAAVISAGEDQTVRVWSVADHGELQQLIGTGSGAMSLSFDAAGRRVIVAGPGGTRILDIRDPAALATSDVGEVLGNTGFVGDGARFFTTSDTGVALWDARDGHRVARFDTGPAQGTHFTPDGSAFAVPLSAAPVTEIHDSATGGVRARLTSDAQPASAVFDHAGRRVATPRVDGAVDVWDVSGRRLATLAGHQGMSLAAAFDADDRRLATAGYNDRTARIWDLGSGRELGHVEASDALLAVAFDGSGDRLLTAGDNRFAQLWDSHTFQLLQSFEHRSSLLAAAISSDGALVAGAVRDGLVSVWDVASGKELYRFHHAQLAVGVDFAPDGARLLSSSSDGHAIVWDVRADVPDAATVAAFVVCHAPYELRGTSLEVVPLRACPAAR